MGERFSLVLTPELTAIIDEAKKETGEETASLLRKAIRKGLPLVKSGGDVVRLSGELSDFVGELAAAYKKTREGILTEAVQRGIRAVELTCMIDKSQNEGVPDGVMDAMDTAYESDIYPEKRAVRQANREKGWLQIKLRDLLLHCQEAKRRADAIEKLAVIRRMPGGGGGGSPWGKGLSTEEMEWQIAMSEKFGPDFSNWPKDETAKHRQDRENRESKKETDWSKTDIHEINKHVEIPVSKQFFSDGDELWASPSSVAKIHAGMDKLKEQVNPASEKPDSAPSPATKTSKPSKQKGGK